MAKDLTNLLIYAQDCVVTLDGKDIHLATDASSLLKAQALLNSTDEVNEDAMNQIEELLVKDIKERKVLRDIRGKMPLIKYIALIGEFFSEAVDGGEEGEQ